MSADDRRQVEFEAHFAQLVRERRGQFGYSTTPQLLAGSQILYFDFPEHLARRWTVHLLAMRSQSGAAVNGLMGPPVPIDQMAQATVQAFVDFGIGGASESVVVDYPWTGQAFPVTCSSFKLRLACTGFLGVGPKLGAMVMPTDGDARGGDDDGATITLDSVVLAGGQQQVFIPARARWYTFALGNTALSAGNAVPRIVQSNPNGVAVYKNDINTTSWDVATAGAYEQLTGSFRFAIHPLATSLVIFSASASDINFSLRFGLDLG